MRQQTLIRTAIAASVVAATVLPISPIGGGVVSAAGTPDVSVDKEMADNTLYGANVPVELTMSNLAGPDGFNLTITDTLPMGVSYVGGSSIPEPTQYDPGDGTTVLVWENVADLLTGTSVVFTYETALDPAQFSVGDSYLNQAAAFVNTDPRVLPEFDAELFTMDPATYTGNDSTSASTTLVPFLLSKTEPSPERELLRGVHEHQTVYTLRVDNNLVNPSNGFEIIDYLPAQLEFLGCGGVDNSTPGTEEYTGSGRLDAGGAPALPLPCPTPADVTTVDVDPDGPSGPLPQGVYTRVTWDAAALDADPALGSNLAAGGVIEFNYVAAIPLLENVLPTLPFASTANLDNNTGPATTETEGAVTNLAFASATYHTDLTPSIVSDDEVVIPEDVSMFKTADRETFQQGEAPVFTLVIDSSEYATGVDPLVVTDTLPPSLDFASAVPAPDGPPVINPDGTSTVTWTLPPLTEPSTRTTITIDTVVRANYRLGDGTDGSPVSSNDAIINTADLTATADIMTAPDGSTESFNLIDSSFAALSASAPTIAKAVGLVAANPDAPLTCGDGAGITFDDNLASSFRPGDHVCWRLTVSFPAALDTINPLVTDFLPPGFAYVSHAFSSNNTVAPGDVTFTDASPRLEWALADIDAVSAVFEVIVQTEIVASPDSFEPGDIVDNLLKFRFSNTDGSVFQARDSANAELSESIVELSKGVIELNASPVAGAPADGVTVQEGDTVTYEVLVTNAGLEDVSDVSIRDVLPTGVTCADVLVVNDGGSCDVANDWIQWDAPAADIDLAAGASAAVTYEVLVPTGISAGASLVNTAGVRTYVGSTNAPDGAGFVYVPTDNIDTTLTPNTDAAGDTSEIVTAPPTVTKTRTTSLTDAGNATNFQAAVGETVSYTVTVTLPAGATYFDARINDPLGGNPLTAEKDLQEATVTATLNGAPVPPGFVLDTSNNRVRLTFPTPYVIPMGDAQVFELTFDAVVTDVNSNRRLTGSSNGVNFDYWNAAGERRRVRRTVGLQIVEPFIVVGKANDDADGVVSAGQAVTYTVDVANEALSRVSTAYDVEVVDTVPPALIVQPGSISNGGVFTPGATAADPGTITWTIPSIAPGGNVLLTYDVITADPLLAGAQLQNDVVATATSMPGDVAGERTSTSTRGDAVGDGYLSLANDIVTVPAITSSKSVEPAVATVGETVTSSIDFTIPGGAIAFDVTVVDNLPDGLTYESLATVVCDQGGGACTPDITIADVTVVPSAPYAPGDDVAFFFDDLTTASPSDRTVTVTYVSFVADVVASDDGATLTNGAALGWNTSDVITAPPDTPPAIGNFEFSTTESSDDVGTVEPALTIDKDVSGQVADTDTRRAQPGDVLTYTVLVTNNGSGDAHDVTVTDVATDPTWAFVDTTAAPGVVNTDADPVGGLEWVIDGPIPGGGGTVTITYTLTVPASFDSTNEVPGPEQSNTADVPSYFGAAQAVREANPSRVFREYDNVAPDTVTVELDLASVGDAVWHDQNGDGVQQPSEPPIVNVDVIVTYLGPDGLLGTLDDEVVVVSTDANGEYLVEGLPGGMYVVDVDETDADFVADMVPTYDLDNGVAGPDGEAAFTLAEDQDRVDVDFGYTGTGSIGDAVWFDQNLDGVDDPNEAGIAGIDVVVTWLGIDGAPGGGDDVVYVATTDTAGAYLVEFLPAGNYTVAVDTADLPVGYENVADPGGENDNAGTATLGVGEAIVDQDFGYAGSGSIGDYVWLDQNGDGVQDGSEPGLGGVILQLVSFGPDGVVGGPDDSTFMTMTAADGSYVFEDLPPGEFQVAITGALPANVVNSYDPDVGGPGDDMSFVTLTVSVPSVTDQDFGYDADSVLGDRVWWDLNGDGVQDMGEPGLNGVEVTVTYLGPDNTIGTVDDEVFVMVTSGDGDYLLEDVPDGEYRAQITGGVQAGYSQTFDASGSQSDATSDTTLVSGDLLQDFGYDGAGSIGDTVWFDIDGDGILDAGEPGLEGVEVSLTWLGPDGVVGGGDDIVLSATTDASGGYLFDGLPTGEFIVAVDAATVPAGMGATYDRDGGTGSPDGSTPVTLADSQAFDDVDFGYNGAGSIGDTVWFDRNGDGVFDADEFPLAGVDVELEWASPTGPITLAATTDAAGQYLFDGLAPADYVVTVLTASLPAGFAATFDVDGGNDSAAAVTLGDAEANLAVDFGYRGAASVGDTVYVDLDGNGSQEAGEPGVVGQTVELSWVGPSGPVTFTTVTGVDGAYLFEHLPDGDFTVTVVGGVVSTGDNTDDPGGNGDSTNDFTITAGDSNLDQDFGYQGLNSLGDLVFLDLDANGAFDGADAGLPSVEVTVLWFGLDGVEGTADDAVLPAVTTDANGSYSVGGLLDGNYSVSMTDGVPSGLDRVTYDGDDLTTNPDGVSIVTALGVGDVSGVDDNAQDFGLTGAGTIGDFIWFDVDANGAQGAAEPGIPGADVTLTWAGADGVFATGDEVVFPTQTTGTDGAYSFTNLPAGNFRIDVAQPLTGVSPTADPDGGAADQAVITIAANGTNNDQDFGYSGTSSIGDLVWLDQNLNGVQDVGEDGIGGIGLTVTWAGFDGALDTADDLAYTATTDVDGAYLVEHLPNGDYRVAVDTADLPGDYVNVFDPDADNDSQNELTLAGSSDVAQDFGYAGNGSIGDTIYLDQDGNGSQNGSEPNLVGVTVQLVHFGPDGVVGGADDTVVTAVTDGSGSYLFENLPQGVYEVSVIGGITGLVNTDDPDLPAGAPDVGDSVATTTLTVLSPDNLGLDFGYQAISVLGDRVWWDINGDGVQDTGEPGLSGAVVQIISDDLATPVETTTDVNGDYLFANIPNSEYIVSVIGGIPAGVTPTFDSDGGDDATAETILVDSDLLQDFGFTGAGTIGDRVWFDTNGDGVLDAGEFGLEGVELTLTWLDPDGDPDTDDDIALTVATDSLGMYTFDNLPDGEFSVVVDATTLPAGVDPTYDRDGLIAAPDGSTLVTLADNASVDDVDFGYNGGGLIGDTIWFDRDGDGVFGATESPLTGIGVTLEWAGPTGPQVFNTTTDAAGMYTFESLPAGDFTVSVDVGDLPPGMAPTSDADSDVIGLGSTSALTLAPSEENRDQDFGYNGASSIGDTIFLDLDGDGAHGPTEPGVAGQFVELTWASPAGPVLFTTTTDADGRYSFANLPGGDYTVAVVGGIVDAAVNSADPGADGDSANSLALLPGEVNADQDFGYRGINSIGDQVWYDVNADGVFDAANEPGIASAEVSVVWLGPDGLSGTADDVLLPIVITDADGAFLVENLPDGSYSVTVSGGLPPGVDVPTYDADDGTAGPDGMSVVVDLGVGSDEPEIELGQDFGFTGGGTIGDLVWLDADGDGAVGAGEGGLNGAEVTLTWAGPDGVLDTADDVVYPTQMVGGDGSYLFELLPAGDFRVDVSVPVAQLTATADPDAGAPHTAVVALAPAEQNLDQDFGYRGIAGVGDTIFLDVNADGVQDANEPGIAGVTVTVRSAGTDGVTGTADDIITVVATDANGQYLVELLPAGPVTVSYDIGDLPAGYGAHSDRDCRVGAPLTEALDPPDCDDVSSTTVDLIVGETVTDVDFGVVGNARLEGTVWVDTDGDGVLDAGELGIAGVTVEVTWDGPSGPVTMTVVTDASGRWILDHLPPGDYTVDVVDSTVPSGLSPTTADEVDVNLVVGGSGQVENGYVPTGSISGMLFIDDDRDGVIDAAEPGVAGITVELRDVAGLVIATTTTDATGSYFFGDLVPGTYTVTVVASTVPHDFRVVSDRDGIADGSTSVSVGPGDDVREVNFGIDTDPLPFTGGAIGRTLTLGIVLIGAGIVLLSSRRRREIA